MTIILDEERQKAFEQLAHDEQSTEYTFNLAYQAAMTANTQIRRHRNNLWISIFKDYELDPTKTFQTVSVDGKLEIQEVVEQNQTS